MANNWVHVAAVFNNGAPSPANNKLYINGVLQTLNSYFAAPSQVTVTPTAYISGWGLNNSYRFGGLIDEVRIWDGERTQAAILQYMHRTLTGTEPGLLGYWRFDEGAGTSANDVSGHGHVGELRNGPTWIISTAPINEEHAVPVITTMGAIALFLLLLVIGLLMRRRTLVASKR